MESFLIRKIVFQKSEVTDSKLKEISKQIGLALLEDSTFSLETRDRKMPHPLKSVYYVGDNGEEIDIQKGGVAGKIFGWIIFILILIPACYFGGRFLYRKHQTHRYAHPLSAPRDDTVIYYKGFYAGKLQKYLASDY